MKRLIILLFILFIENQVLSKLSDQKRQNLLNKLTKKITFDNLDEFKNMRFDFESTSQKNGIDYDPARIQKIIEENDFPQEYNFLEDTNATVHVKDQQNCGCCWSHAATTALAYRYHKIGIEVDLSPQDALSCYLRDCERGNYPIDPEMNLVKNGTVTEGCLPFSSGDGRVVDECPTSCKDGSEYKKYYAENAYTTTDYYSQETFYDIVTLIMDQLITNGPLVTSIQVYWDFVELNNNPQKCHDEVYTYDGTSQNLGGHALAIVGYGFLDDKYYWLIQNSWGEEACDQGFVKIEFGQVNVEKVSFATPYLPGEVITPTELSITFDSMDELCNMMVTTTSGLDKWENTLEVTFQHSKGIKDFNYQCGVNTLPGGNYKLNCYYEMMNYFTYKGVYEFKDSQSLGTENKFNLDNSFDGKTFNFWGVDMIESISPFYISEEGSRITFAYLTDDESALPPIYPNEDINTPLSNCKTIKMTLYGQEGNLIYCDIKKEELQYFNYPNSTSKQVVYDVLCGYKESFSYVFLLDKNNYASFNITEFKLPESKILLDKTILTFVAEIDGHLEGYKDSNNYFLSFVNVEKNNTNTTGEILCVLEKYNKTVTQLELQCILFLEQTMEFDNLYLLPYHLTYEMPDHNENQVPFEIIIKKEIKAGDSPEPGPEPEPSFSRYSRVSFGLILALLLMF